MEDEEEKEREKDDEDESRKRRMRTLLIEKRIFCTVLLHFKRH